MGFVLLERSYRDSTCRFYATRVAWVWVYVRWTRNRLSLDSAVIPGGKQLGSCYPVCLGGLFDDKER